MKTFLFGVCALWAVCIISAVPVPDKKEEVEIVPLERNPYGDQPIIDTGVGGFGIPLSNPFDGFLNSFESLMARMRHQMDSLFGRLPGRSSNSSNIPDFEGLPHLPFGDIDLSKGNTTSVTKVIDGHKVVINETEYKKQDDFGGTFFKVRIIDVKPDSSEVTTEKEAEEVTVTPATKDREPLENSVENEILKSQEATRDDIETFDEVDSAVPHGQAIASTHADWQSLEPVEIFEDNSVLSETQKPVDLSRDIYVNQLMADQGAPVNPDAEVIFVPEGKRGPYYGKLIDPR